MVNEHLVRQGYARVATFPPNVKYQVRFLEAERQARAQNAGLWAQEPSEQEVKADTEAAPYVASKKSEVFHKASCPLAERIAPENLIRFETVKEAKESGRRGCKRSCLGE